MTDDEIEVLAKKHIAPHADRLENLLPHRPPYQQTEQFRRVKALIADVLSKLRAPVADERHELRDALRAFTGFAAERRAELGELSPEMEAIDTRARAALASAPVADAAPEYAYSDDGKTVTMTNANRAPGYWESAPVAGEAKPVAEVVSRYGDPEEFGERDLKVLVDLNSYPYGTKFYAAPQASATIKQSLNVAPQASEAVRDAALEEAAKVAGCTVAGDASPDNPYRGGTAKQAAARIRALKSQSPALSAQPGAQKGGSDA